MPLGRKSQKQTEDWRKAKEAKSQEKERTVDKEAIADAKALVTHRQEIYAETNSSAAWQSLQDAIDAYQELLRG